MPANYPYIQVPFATSGDKDSIPVQTDPSGAISWTQGYGPDYQRDLETDPLAKPIERGGMNQLFYAISAASKAWQDNAVPDWVPASETGGIQNPYGLGVWVRYTTGGTTSLYVSLEANNTETPGSGTKWGAAPYRVASAAEMSAGAGAYPVTVSQARNLITTYAPAPPDGTTTAKGIVQLSTATNDSADTGKAATPSAVARKFGAALNPLGAINLNILTGPESRGVYWQADDALATTANNYPAGAAAGTLLVVGDIGGGSPLQTYIASNGRMWTRRSATSPWLSLSDSYGVPIAASDYNAITQNGQYTFGAGATNRPSGFGSSWAVHFASGGLGGTLAFDTASNRMAYRPITSGGYGQWQDLWNAANFDPASNVGSGMENLKGAASGTSAIVMYSADRVDMRDSAGRVYSARNVNVSINSATVGANGLDTGVLAASTWYAAWLIGNSSTGTVAGVLSLSSTGPVLPSGFTFKVRVGWVRTDATNKYPLSFLQAGRRVQYRVSGGSNVPSLPLMATGVQGTWNPSSPTWAAIAIASFAPPTAIAISLSLSNVYNVGSPVNVFVAPSNQYSGQQSTNPPPICYGSTMAMTMIQDMLIESPNVYAAANGAGFSMQCFGWEDCI